MRNLIRQSFNVSAVTAAIFAASGTVAHAQSVPIAYFDFNQAPTATSAANTEATEISELFTVSGGANAASAAISSNFTTVAPASASNTSPAGITSFTGTTVGAVSGDTAGAALALQGGASGATGNVNNGDYLQFSTNTTGFRNISLSFTIQGTSTGFNSDQIEYSTDGTTFTNYTGSSVSSTGIAITNGVFAPSTSFVLNGVFTPDFSGISVLNTGSTDYFRIVFNGATSTTGNNRIDNLQILGTAVSGGGASATPEPGSIALLGLGLLPVGAVVRRRISRKG